MEIQPQDIQAFKHTAQELFADGHELRTTASPKTMRSYKSPAHLWERLGKFIGNSFAGSIEFNTDEQVPSVVLRLGKNGTGYLVEYIDATIETEGISLTEANGKYKEQRKFGVIGYDTEFLDTSKSEKKKVDKPEIDEAVNDEFKVDAAKRLLSHQFCFDIGPGKRFGLILDTDIRFTDETFRDFLAAIVLNLAENTLNTWYIFAHFSLAEGSWIDSSKKKLIQRKKKEWTGTLKLAERKSEDPDKSEATATTGRKRGKRKVGDPKPEKIKLTFADTMNLDPRSLKAAAKDCGLKKYTVLPERHEEKHWFKKSCDRVYKHLDKCKNCKPGEFYRYGVRDAIITAGIPIVLHSKFGADAGFQVRTARYSEKHMSVWFSENYKGIHDGWQRVLGQRKLVIPAKKAGSDPFEKWEPDKLQRQILHDWYKGGRNEARQIGCFSQKVSYFDMTSAYPTALAALASDFDFGSPLVRTRTRNDGAVQRIKQLMPKGPFQPHGVRVYIRFKPDCKVPMAPLSAEPVLFIRWKQKGRLFVGRNIGRQSSWTLLKKNLYWRCTNSRRLKHGCCLTKFWK